MFIAALFTIAKTCKPKCPSTDDRFKKMYYVIIVCMYTHTHTHTQWNITQSLKKNEILPFAANVGGSGE